MTTACDLDKDIAVKTWTREPCGWRLGAGEELGSASYFSRLRSGRAKYAPWMDAALAYEGTAGLEVLDVGCGQGIDLVRFAEAGASVTGIDLTPRHVELAQAHLVCAGLDGRVVQGDAEELPFPDAAFDRVSSNGVLHHTPDFRQAFREIRRVLRPGGEARIILYNKASVYFWSTQVLGHGLLQGRLFREKTMERVVGYEEAGAERGEVPLVKLLTPRRFRRELQAAGFRNVRIEIHHFGAQHFPLTRPLARFEIIQRNRLFRCIGQRWGWYMTGIARRSW